MVKLAESYLYSPAWTIMNMIALAWGLLGIVFLLMGYAGTAKQKLFAWSGISLLVATVLFSMLFEELLPLARRTSWQNASRVALGMAGFMIATIAFVNAGRLLVRSILAGSTWKHGLLWFAGSVCLFVLSSLTYNFDKIQKW